MPLYKNILYDITLDEEFRRNKSGFSRAVYWSRDVMSGIGHLFDLGICHLYVKSNNDLTDDYDIALLYDLGYVVEPLTLTEKIWYSIRLQATRRNKYSRRLIFSRWLCSR